jgi:hypothetical protein
MNELSNSQQENTFVADVPHGVIGWSRKLVISDSLLQYTGATPQQSKEWPLADIVAVRYGYQSLVFYRFHFGTSYSIALQHTNGDVLNIRFFSFSTHEDHYWELYADIVEALEQRVVRRLEDEWLSRIAAGSPVQFGKITLSQEGVQLADKELIPWGDCYVQHTHQSFFINSHSNNRLFAVVQPQRTWNAAVLIAVLETLLTQQATSSEATGNSSTL